MGNVTVRLRGTKKGKPNYEYSFEVAAVNGKRRRKSKCGFSTKKEAREAGRIALETYEKIGEVPKDNNMSLSDLLAMWIQNDSTLSCKENTVTSYKKKIRLYIEPQLGEYRIKSITKDMLQEHITQMYNDGFSINTISNIRGILSKCFSYALDKKFLLLSPANGLKIPTNKVPKIPTARNPHIYITKAEMNSIFKRFPEGSPSHIPLMLGYHCGLRLGEIFGLTWEDIDFDNKTLAVSRQVQWHQKEKTTDEKNQENELFKGNSYWFFTEPKYKSYRIVDLDDTIYELLKREKKRQEKAEKYYDEYYIHYYTSEKLYSGGIEPKHYISPEIKIEKGTGEHEVHFVNRRENGSFISPATTQHASKIIRTNLGVPEFDMHSLRHTHATMLMENEVDIVYIQHRLGHKDVSVTMNIYTNHITEKIQRTNNEKLNNIF